VKWNLGEAGQQIINAEFEANVGPGADSLFASM
jgi:hypothetical protein